MTDLFFSCRNCIHNVGQSLIIGRCHGYCMKHATVIEASDITTCKYLHRKDLPRFQVDEGLREHAAEYSEFEKPVNMLRRETFLLQTYSERNVWEHHLFDPITNAIVRYPDDKNERSWVFISAFQTGRDGRKSLAYSCLLRRYMDKCGHWSSAYRQILGFLHVMADIPAFDGNEIHSDFNLDEAIFDIVFCRISTIQEYGFHAGLRDMIWAAESLNGSLQTESPAEIFPALKRAAEKWTQEVIGHAQRENQFFPRHEATPSQDFI